jgi:hypothetical protein
MPFYSEAVEQQCSTAAVHALAPFSFQAMYVTRDLATGRYKPHPLKGEEVACVDQVV